VPRHKFQRRWVSRGRSATASVLMLSVAAFGPTVSQLTVLHRHGHTADHTHQVPVEELGIWRTVHAHLHARGPTKQNLRVPISQGLTVEAMDTDSSGTVILVNVVNMMQPSDPSTEDSIDQLSPSDSLVYACCSSNLQKFASGSSQSNWDATFRTAPSLVTGILRANHALLV
jgi:hypothetical protein